MIDKITVSEHGGGHNQDKHRQPAGKNIHLPQQRRGERFHIGEHAADAADFGAAAGGGDHAQAGAAGHQCAAEEHRRAVAQRGIGAYGLGGFVCRHRFAGEHGFFAFEPVRVDEAQIGRHAVARFQQHNIAGHQIGSIQALAAAIAQHRRMRRKHAFDGDHGFFGFTLLDKSD